jgi:hypothetical protein
MDVNFYNRIKRKQLRLYGDYESTYNEFDQPYSRLMLFGTNSKKIITNAIELFDPDLDGCSYMPHINNEQVAEAYVTLIKKKLTPGGFLHLTSSNNEDHVSWGGNYGDAIYENRNTPFITIANKFTKVFISDEGGNLREMELAIIDKNFKPTSAKPRKTKKA